MRNMIRKLKYLIVSVLFLLMIVLLLKPVEKHKKQTDLELRQVKTESGWAYDILVNQKTFIHQECIPAINCKKAFYSKNDASKTGKLVIEKLKKGEIPTISINELDSLKIRYVE